jgi:hypothetical protein
MPWHRREIERPATIICRQAAIAAAAATCRLKSGRLERKIQLLLEARKLAHCRGASRSEIEADFKQDEWLH